MNKLRECRLIIRTGEHGTDHDVIVKINGFRLVARKLAGGTDSGETMLAKLFIASVVHTLTLCQEGPGEWDIDTIELFGIMDDGAITYVKVQPEESLADGREVNIWRAPEKPQASQAIDGFDV
jgi:hypothetical protein